MLGTQGCDDSRQRDEHRGLCVSLLPRLEERDDWCWRDECRLFRVFLQRFDERDNPRQRDKPLSLCISEL